MEQLKTLLEMLEGMIKKVKEINDPNEAYSNGVLEGLAMARNRVEVFIKFADKEIQRPWQK